MSFFQRAMASIGIGSAKVDAVFESSILRVGDEISGYLNITGGNIEQNVDNVYIELMTYYKREVNSGTDNETTIREDISIARYDFNSSFMLHPKEVKQIPFTLEIPLDTPLSIKKDSVWFKTGLDIKGAIDPKDNDYVNIQPHPYVESVLDVLMHDWGFHLRECENEYSHYHALRLPFVQEFEFVPTGFLRDRVQELEMIFFLRNDGLDIIMEVDRRARGFKGLLLDALDMDEHIIRFHIASEIFEEGNHAVAQYISDAIYQYT